MIGTALLAAAAAAAAFTVVVLPDTQHYAEFRPEILHAQTQWIVDHREAESIAFVVQEGDLTNSNAPAQWANVDAAFARLDGVVPYLVVPGNHDTGPGGRAEVRDTALFNQTFPLSRFSGRPEFVEAFEADRSDNTAQAFRAGGTDWLVVGLEFGPRDAAVAWARQVIGRHPRHRVLLVTHDNLYFDDTLHGASPYQSWNPHRYPLAGPPGAVNDGVDLWEKLGRRHANLAFVLNGHVIGDGAARLQTAGDHGHPVWHLLANYQMRADGGEGYLRLMRFDPAAGTVSVRTYSPWLDAFLTDGQQQFELGGLALGPLAADGRPHADAGTDRDVIDADGDGLAAVTLDGTGSTDPGGSLVEWTWTERGAPIASGPAPTVTLPVGRHALVLTVRDDDGLTLSDAVSVEVHPASILLAERFGAPALSGWTVVDDGSVNAPSRWSPVHGGAWQSSNIHGPDASATSHRLGTRLLWSGPGSDLWSDYTLSATVGTADDDGVGVVVRAGSGGFYKLDLDRQRTFRKLFRTLAGTETTLAVESAGYEAGRDLPLRVRVERSRLSFSLDGRILFGGPVSDGALDAGTIGLYTWGATEVAFDDVAVATGCGVPWEIEGVSVSGSTLSWDLAAFADEYDVLRGTLAGLGSGRYGTCLLDAVPTDRQLVDPGIPAPGEGFTYLVRGRSILCAGTGTFGATSAGEPRQPSPGPSCP